MEARDLGSKSLDKRSLGRKNRIVLLSFTDSELSALWEKYHHTVAMVENSTEPAPFSGCWVWQGSLQNGYPAVSQGHGKSKIKIHILAAWTLYGRMPGEEEVVSHRCHRKVCIRPEHLIIETINANNQRKGCLRALVDHNSQVWNLCWHYPQCLRRDTEVVGDFMPAVIGHQTFESSPVPEIVIMDSQEL